MNNSLPRCARLSALLLSWLTIFPGGVASASNASFDELSPGQQRVLAGHEQSWATKPASERDRLARGAQRWLSASPAERARLTERYRRFQALPPERRQALRQRLGWFRELSPQQQRKLRQRMQRWRALPPEQRKRLRERFDNLSAEQRMQALDRMRQRTERRANRNREPGDRRPQSR